MDKFQQRFIDEAGEYFENLELNLLSLENDFSKTELIEEVFRIMHSLKGSGAMFGFVDLSDATHDLESLYDLVRTGQLTLNSSIIGYTLKSIDLLKKLLVTSIGPEIRADLFAFKAEVAGILSGNTSEHVVDLTTAKAKAEPTRNIKKENVYFISFVPNEDILKNGTNPLFLIDELHTLGKCIAKASFENVAQLSELDPLMCYTSWRAILSTSESSSDVEDVFLFVKDNAQLDIISILNTDATEVESSNKLFDLPLAKAVIFAQEEPGVIEELNESSADDSAVGTKKSLSSIRVNSQKIDEYMNLVSEMITAQSRLSLLSSAGNDQELINLSETFQKLIRQLRDNAFNMSLVPLFNMMARFKRLVRDLSSDLGKEIELLTEGLETEVDKNMIEQLTDPILHIIRNCIDHGIEMPDERIRKGKSAKGNISVKASYVGTFVQIEIKDDGAGLNFERIKEKAIERGMLSKEKEVSYSELVKIILEPGFSTASAVSDVSGRGVGMDVIQQAIRNMRGELDVDSTQGEGTEIILRLPLSLSIIDGLLSRVNEDYYVIPTNSIEKIYELKDGDLEDGLRQIIVLDGLEIPYLNLRTEFDTKAIRLKKQYLIAVRAENECLFGLIVDDVLREYQAVVKPLGKMLKRHEMFLGASILGDGKIALVLDTKKIIKKYSV